MERAAVIGGGGSCRRPLRALRGRGIEVVALPSDADALVVLDAIRAARADTVWLPEPLSSELCARCAALGIAVIGPPAQALEGAADRLSRIPGVPSGPPAPDARTIEVFVAADASGTVRTLALSERLAPGLDEAPAALSPAQGAAAASAAESLCRSLGWSGLGVVDIALDEKGPAVRGVATASSAELAVEEATGLDLVELRLALHLGEPLPAVPSLSRAAFSACLRVPAAATASDVLLLRLRASSDDPRDRDVSPSPHPSGMGGFATVGEVFSAEKNPDRKKPFDIRAVMAAVADSDRAPLERWRDPRNGDTAVVWDASLIGGAPAAAVVFTREVESRVRKDPRFAAAPAAARARLRTEKMGEVAAEYDRVHTIERAVRVGSVERIVKPRDLRPALIDAVERGIARALQ